MADICRTELQESHLTTVADLEIWQDVGDRPRSRVRRVKKSPST